MPAFSRTGDSRYTRGLSSCQSPHRPISEMRKTGNEKMPVDFLSDTP
jgi:hypothetical protein